MIDVALTGWLQVTWDIVVCILLVAAELFVTALAVAPRFMMRKLRALLGSPVRYVQRVLGAPGGRRERVHPTQEGA